MHAKADYENNCHHENNLTINFYYQIVNLPFTYLDISIHNDGSV
jgi:hypothetical protein